MPADDEKPRRKRSPKLTDAMILGIMQVILDGNYRCVAAQRFNVLPERLRKWIALGDKYPDGIYGRLRWAVLEAEAEAEAASVKAIKSDPDPKSQQWWLERKFNDRWGKNTFEMRMLKKEIAELKKMFTDVLRPPVEA
jgi:hypothetical protein